jgi:sodium/proline symporter
MAIRNPEEIKISRRIASVWVVLSMAVAVFIGIIGYSVSVAGGIPFLTSSSESETIIICLANLMGKNGVFFAIVAGIIMRESLRQPCQPQIHSFLQHPALCQRIF